MRFRKTIRKTANDLQALKQREFLDRRAAMIETLESRRLLSAGDLDTTFSGDGKQTTDLGTNEQANKVLVQSDGKVLVIGSANGDARIVRYNANGSLDTTFDGDGSTRLSWSGTENFADAALLPDGRIVVGGNHNGGWWVARYLPNGSLDVNSGFGGSDGIYNGSSAGGSGQITQLELQGTNIITADSFGNVRRHSGSTGGLDTSFGSGGFVNVDSATGMTNFQLFDLAIAPGGKIAVAGGAFPGEDSNEVEAYAVARLNANGSADSTFAGDGSFVSDFIGGGGRAAGVIAQPDGKLVTIGQEEDADAAIVRLNVNGTIDTTFGAGQDGRFGPGSTVTIGYPAPTGPLGPDLALQPNGKILVSGSQEIGVDFTSDFVVQRFTSSGLADNTFSGDSLASVNFSGDSVDHASSIALAPDGKIVLAGNTGEPGTVFQLAVARLQGGDTTTPPPGDGPVYIEDRVLWVDGTAGNDTIKTEGGFFGEETVQITLNGVTSTWNKADFDRILVRGFGGNDSLDDGVHAQLRFEGGDGNDYMSTWADEGKPVGTMDGGAGDDTFEYEFDGVSPPRFDGGIGRDTYIVTDHATNLDLRVSPTVEDARLVQGILTGNSLNNTLRLEVGGQIFAGDGNDTLHGADADDNLYGENGNDRIMAGGGDDLVDGGFGNDTLYGDAGADTVRGQQGNDYLWARDGERDTLDGGVGNYDRAQIDSIDAATNMEAFIA